MSQRTLRRVAHLTLLLLIVSALVDVIGSATAQTRDVDRTDLRGRNSSADRLRGAWYPWDPYQYRERLALPTYQICATGDQFFLPDSPRYYFADLPGEKYLRFVPNSDHGMASPDAAANLIAWFRAVTQNNPRPRFYWRADRKAGSITVRVVDAPAQVMLWQATNPKARDFRLETLGPAWTSTPLTGANGIYTATVPAAEGWTAFFVELTYPGDTPLVFTTEVVVTPDVYPFDPPSTAGPPPRSESSR